MPLFGKKRSLAPSITKLNETLEILYKRELLLETRIQNEYQRAKDFRKQGNDKDKEKIANARQNIEAQFTSSESAREDSNRQYSDSGEHFEIWNQSLNSPVPDDDLMKELEELFEGEETDFDAE